MNTTQRTAKRIAVRQYWPPRDTICNSCLHRLSLQQRQYASAATAVADAPGSLSPQSTPATIPDAGTQRVYQMKAGLLLTRAPLLTRPLHPFEKAYFLYQRRLNERLAQPFTRYFYFKKGTPADLEWKRKAKARLTPARDIGVYNAFGKEGWNDEVLVGDRVSEPEEQIEALVKDSEVPSVGARAGGGAETGQQDRSQELERPVPRITDADKSGDQRSLNRLLDRSLYLLVKNAQGKWTFPSGRIEGRENLHQAAERIIVKSAGINMNTWIVGNAPVGHFQRRFPKTISNEANGLEESGEKTFFMKVRIMAGQADMAKNELGDTDFKWLAKEEVEQIVHPQYWSQVRNMLVER
ncbi:hypothetical protein LTR66_002881 [Elasticomyces elasticus]|nr:hypothetical protein LTR50_006703 [Elasticomyces elasticus]KAK4997752.1 hypothetical protein LTR66_002881 [Elasticomyces elasticus]